MRKPNERLSEIGKQCRELRIALNMTLKEVAEIANTTPQNISYFEKGQNDSAVILDTYLTLSTKEWIKNG